MKKYHVENYYHLNQFLIEGEGQTIFQSYDSTIALIDQDGLLTLCSKWDYSNTTLKHLYYFLHDFKHRMKLSLGEYISEALLSNNKKKAIQKLIYKHIINYNEEE